MIQDPVRPDLEGRPDQDAPELAAPGLADNPPATPRPPYPTASVIVVTLNRPDFVRTCLSRLAEQTVAPLEVIVVDSSPDNRTADLVTGEFPDVAYLRNPRGAGSTATARNLGLQQSRGEIVAFVDDDAFADADWLEQLLTVYVENPRVGGVGGRARNGIVGEEGVGLSEIGLFRADGTLTGNFAADPGQIIPVEHLLGANMSFRRQALLDIGGIHDGYPGTCLCEETDIAFRVKEAGWHLLFAPRSCVDHVAAPYPKGKRFDIRYMYYTHRNHIVLLSRTKGGYGSRHFYRYLGVSARRSGSEIARAGRALRRPGYRDLALSARTAAGGTSRAAAVASGCVAGLVAGSRQRRADRRARR